MRKMTKTAVTLAAMSAMTAAAASMAFAAEKQEPNISSVAKQVETVNSSAVGEWSGSDVNGWKFTKEGGTKLKDQWAEIDGVWYYFIGEKMAQDRFLTLDNKGYFFDHTGRLATGWQRITSDMDAYSDIDIADALYDPYNNYYVHVNDNAEYGYHDYVWCYFDNSGVAKHNEWFQDGSGLWYYFDGDVMVKNVYNYIVTPDNYDAADSNAERIYGFDEEGAMLIGWNYKETDDKWNDPTADDKGRIWYYYNSNGKMQKAGWKSIDGKWYLFADYNADNAKGYGVGTRDDDRWSIGGYPLITNSYVASYNRDKYEYFYVDKDGKMVTGVKEVPKEAHKVLFYTDPNMDNSYGLGNVYETVSVGGAVTVNFGSNGAAKDGIVDNRYYVLKEENTRKVPFKEVEKLSNSVYKAVNAFDGYAPKNITWTFSQGGDDVISKDDKVLNVPVVDFTADKFVEVTFDDSILLEDKLEKTLTGGTVSYYVEKTAANNKLVEKLGSAYNDVKAGSVLRNTLASNKVSYETALSTMKNIAIKYKNGAVEYKGEEIFGNVYWVIGELNTNAVTAADPYAGIRSRSTIEYKSVREERTAWERTLTLVESQILREGLTEDLKAKREKAKFVLTELDNIELDITSVKEDVYSEDVVNKYEVYGATYDQLVKQIKVYEDTKKALTNAGIYTLNTTTGKLTLVNGGNAAEIARLTNNFAVRGELVKEALIAQNDYVYFADDKGDLLANKAVVFNTEAGITLDGTSYNNAYILFGSDGKGIYDYYGKKKSISIGGVTYWATNQTVQVGTKAKPLTVFVANRKLSASDTSY